MIIANDEHSGLFMASTEGEGSFVRVVRRTDKGLRVSVFDETSGQGGHLTLSRDDAITLATFLTSAYVEDIITMPCDELDEITREV